MKTYQFILAAVFLACSLLWHSSSAEAKSLQETKYDLHFKKYAAMHMPGVDWKLLKAQCYAESAFIEQAVSPVGAKGLCQFMTPTWNDVTRKFPGYDNPFDPRQNIHMAAYYMGYLRGQWSSPRPEWDRHSLAMASYNAGLGNMLKAQKHCGTPLLYKEIVECLPDVTGHNSKETITYVERIWRFWNALVLNLR